MSETNVVSLVVDGQSFLGWEDVRIGRGIEHMAGAFAIKVSLKWSEDDEPFEIREGLRCELKIDQDVVITGYIDEYEPSYDAEKSTFTIHGRDKTGDLVDCTAIHKTGQWHNVGLLQIVQDIVQPFAIKVVVEEGLDLGDAFPSFALEEGETAFCAIDRACRMRGVLCTSTPQGDVLLTITSDEDSGVMLIEGENIKSASARHSWKERFSQVTLKGQMKGDDFNSGASVAHVIAQATDKEIDRYRPLVVIAEHGAGTGTLQERAAWETRVRMGRGKRGTVEVVGWRTGKDGQEGPLWQPNVQVGIHSPRLQLADDMLIANVEFIENEEKGRVTELTFCRPEAFEIVEGIRRSGLSGKINHRTQREKHKKKGRGFNGSFSLDAPTVETGN